MRTDVIYNYIFINLLNVNQKRCENQTLSTFFDTAEGLQTGQVLAHSEHADQDHW